MLLPVWRQKTVSKCLIISICKRKDCCMDHASVLFYLKLGALFAHLDIDTAPQKS